MKIKLPLLLSLFFAAAAHGQTKIITGPKHAIFIDIPKNWTQVRNNKLPLFLKPEVNVSATTYMYVYGLDYNSHPDIYGWLQGDMEDFERKHPGMQVDSLHADLPNLKSNGYQTGRYKIVTYSYEDDHKEAILIVECKNTIATVVLSASNNDEFNKYLPSFEEAIRSAKVLGSKVTVEKQLRCVFVKSGADY